MLMKRAFDIFSFFVSLCLYQYMQSDSLFTGIFTLFCKRYLKILTKPPVLNFTRA